MHVATSRGATMNRTVLAYVALGFSLTAWAQAPVAGDPNAPYYPPQPNYPQQQPQPYYQPQQQQPYYPPQGQQQQPVNGPRLSPQELGNLVAPIALYPDMILSQVLAASTYPAELTEAQQWMQSNPGLRGPALVDAAKQQNWDPSVQAMVAFPQVLGYLTANMQWTTDLGNAFLAQQADMMDAIQHMRAMARNNGRLQDTSQERISYEQQNGQNAIVIQPTDPQTVYVPSYNPAYVWGPPAYGYYPALAYPGIGYGIVYGVGTFLGGLFAGLLGFGGWGWGCSWLGHGLFLNGLFFSHFGFHGGGYGGYGFHGGYGGYGGRSAWVHDSSHRLGVPYGGHYAGGARYSAAGGARYGGGNYAAARSFSGAGRAGYAGGGYQGGSSRQAEAYRGLSAGSARSGAGYSSAYRGNSGYSQARSFAGNSGSARSYSNGGYGSANRGNYGSARNSSSYAANRNFGGSGSFGSGRGWSGGSSGSHYSVPKSSGSSRGGGGGGHSSGGGRSHSSGGGGGHSHGGGHKR